MRYEFHPVTADRWQDLEALFGKRGACGGCWCRFWKVTRKEFEARKGEGNRKALRKDVVSGNIPGILAYAAGEPVGWCAVEPRASFPTLARSRVLQPLDDRPVWSTPCFFIRRDFRRRGLTTLLLKAAAKYAASCGAEILEGYPVEPASGTTADVFAYTGLTSSFVKAGFREAGRRSPHRPIMRLKLQGIKRKDRKERKGGTE